MIKKIRRLLILAILFIALFILKGTNVFATAGDEYFANFKNIENGKTYNLYVGEQMHIIDQNTFYGLQPYAAITFNIENENYVKEGYSPLCIRACKKGQSKVSITVDYNGEIVSKYLNIKIIETDASKKLDSKTNDIKNIVSTNSKTEVLLANSELWEVDDKSFEFSKKNSGNIKKYVYSSVYYEETDNKLDNIKLTQKLKENDILYAKLEKSEKKIEDIKQFNNFGFLKENGNFYMYKYKDGKFGYSKKASEVDELIGDYLYIKDGKTYTIYGKKIFDFKIKQASKGSSTCGSGVVLDKKDQLWSYYFDNDQYKTQKIASNVKELIGTGFYKTKDGKTYFTFGEESDFAIREGVSLKSIGEEFTGYNYLQLNDDKKAYLNEMLVLDNVEQIYQLNNVLDTALLVRKDGSIWKLEIAGKASLTKVRSGKESIKKISQPTNVKVAKSGSKNIKVSWKKVDGASKYTVYRATSKNGSYKKIGTTKSGSYTDKKATVGKTYYYKIVANHANTDYSSSRTSAIKMKIPKAPTKLKVSKKSKTSMKVSYKKSSGVTGYEIKYSTSKNFKNSKTKDLKGTSVTIKSLKKNKTYYVKVRAYQTINGKKVYSTYSSTKSIRVR